MIDQAILLNNRNRLIAWQQEHYWRAKRDGEVRLNLGCGEIRWPGYTNCDLYPTQKAGEPDMRLDLAAPPYPFDAGSVDEISCHHVLEHLPFATTEPVLREWHRILKDGGLVDIGVPDTELCMEMYGKARAGGNEALRTWALKTVYGCQQHPDGSYHPGQEHKAPFIRRELEALLKRIGFQIVESFWYDAYDQPAVWVLARKLAPGEVPASGLIHPTALEQECVMGTFTHRTTYLPALLESVKRHLPHIPFVAKVNSAPINVNMELLRRDFLASGKRYWLFLDDDIQFLHDGIVHDAIAAMVRHGWAVATVYSTFDPEWIRGGYRVSDLAERETKWATGYFILVDSKQVGDVAPDLALPDGCTAVDTSYSVAIRARGHKIGIVPHVVYHTRKEGSWVNEAAIEPTNRYLMGKWGQFYFDVAQYDGNVIDPGWEVAL